MFDEIINAHQAVITKYGEADAALLKDKANAISKGDDKTG